MEKLNLCIIRSMLESNLDNANKVVSFCLFRLTDCSRVYLCVGQFVCVYMYIYVCVCGICKHRPTTLAKGAKTQLRLQRQRCVSPFWVKTYGKFDPKDYIKELFAYDL